MHKSRRGCLRQLDSPMDGNHMNDLLNAPFFQKLFEIIMTVVIGLINVLLLPFSILIKSTLPNLDAALTQVSAFFDYAGTYMSWVLNAFAIPAVVVALLLGYWTFVVTATSGAWLIKHIIKWKKAIFT